MKQRKQRAARIQILHKGMRPGALMLAAYDLFAVSIAYYFALWIRFDCRYSAIPEKYLDCWQRFSPFYAVGSVLLLWGLRLYQSVWKYASFTELKRLTLSTLILTPLHVAAMALLYGRMPVSYYIIGAGIQFMLLLLPRFGYRFISLEHRKKRAVQQKNIAYRAMLIGAGSAGQMILRDLNGAKQITDYICCIIDDDPAKWGCFIDGIPIVGGRDDILLNVKKHRIEKIFLAIPSATAEQRRDILNICKMTDCELKNLPNMQQIVNGQVNVGTMRDVAPEDLLGREPVQVDMQEIYQFLQNKTILITGGGGSIGSELCRQVAQHEPKKLIILDIYENNAHAIGLELRDKYPQLDLEVLIGSVRDSRRIEQIFSTYRPDVVYHAAAHKHVPLMEDSPCESIKNNAIGTYKTAYAAMKNGCKRFVLISTDKAVNPTNIMGASKRLCEMIVQSFDRKIRNGEAAQLPPMSLHTGDEYGSGTAGHERSADARTEFVAVRFGNVLGSNGSVIPRFKEQIAQGGPVTVTHPDIVRYFMTIPEATSLVLQAGTYAKGGEIFVLDMGEPIKIDAMARNLIRLSGLRPDVDIKVQYTGLRPGEKLYEERLMNEEGMKTTPNRLIHIGRPIMFDTDTFLERLHTLMIAAYDGREDVIRDLVAQIVPTYHPTDTKSAAPVRQMQQEKQETPV